MWDRSPSLPVLALGWTVTLLVAWESYRLTSSSAVEFAVVLLGVFGVGEIALRITDERVGHDGEHARTHERPRWDRPLWAVLVATALVLDHVAPFGGGEVIYYGGALVVALFANEVRRRRASG